MLSFIVQGIRSARNKQKEIWFSHWICWIWKFTWRNSATWIALKNIQPVISTSICTLILPNKVSLFLYWVDFQMRERTRNKWTTLRLCIFISDGTGCWNRYHWKQTSFSARNSQYSRIWTISSKHLTWHIFQPGKRQIWRHYNFHQHAGCTGNQHAEKMMAVYYEKNELKLTGAERKILLEKCCCISDGMWLTSLL